MGAPPAHVAVDALFSSFGEGGAFTAPPSAPVACSVIRSRHDPVVNLPGFETAVRSPGWRADVRQTEVPTRPRPGTDTVTIAATVYEITDAEEDEERTVWRLDLAS